MSKDAQTRWHEVLDHLDSRVDLMEAKLAGNGPLAPELLTPFEPPADLPPLPVAVADRAIDVLRRHAELEQCLDTVMGNLRRRLAQSVQATNRPRSPFSEPTTPRFHDSAV